MDYLSPLELLPPELFWTVLSYTPESVFALRETSPLLKDYVDQFGLDTATEPIVDELTVFSHGQGKPSIMDLFIDVPARKAPLFELRLKLRGLSECKQKLSRKGLTPGTPRMCYVASYNARNDDDDTLLLLGESMGRRIGRVTMLAQGHDRETAEARSRLLEGIQFGKLRCRLKTLCEDAASELLSLTRDHKVHKLSLRVTQVTLCDPERLLLKFASLVRTLNIDQQFDDELSANMPLFFGLNGVEWAPIVVDMFSRRLAKFRIFNAPHPQYLTRRSAEALVKLLPSMGKEVVFESRCAPYIAPVVYTDNGHIIEIDNMLLTITHWSRRRNQPMILLP